MGGAFFSQPWRDLPERDENLKFVKGYKPQNKDAEHLRILLHGPVGGGKSSFINSVESTLRNKVSGRVLTDAISGISFTRKYTTYKCNSDEESYSFIFNDIAGFEEKTNSGCDVEDIILALKGHMKDGYQFDPQHCLQKSDPYYNSSPTLDDKVHVLVSVIPASVISIMSDKILKRMREVRLAASDLGIPQLAILTKVDEACPKVKKNINNVYKNKYLKKQLDQFSQSLGLPPNCIFLVKNYESELNINEDIDKLILCALRQMINLGEDFLNNL